MYKIILLSFFSLTLQAGPHCELFTLSKSEIKNKTKEIYAETIKVSNLRATLNRFTNWIYKPKWRKAFLKRVRNLNRKRGMIPAYYVTDPESTITQIHYFRKKFTVSPDEVNKWPEASKELFEMAPNSVNSWIEAYKNYPKLKDKLLERVISLENQLVELEKMRSFNKRAELYTLYEGDVVLDRKYSRFVKDEDDKQQLMNAINNEIIQITGNSFLGFRLGSILKLEHKQAILQSQLDLLWRELDAYQSSEKLYNVEEFSEIYQELSRILEKKPYDKPTKEIIELRPEELAKSQLRLHETHQELIDLIVPSFLKREAKTEEQKLARLKKLRDEQLEAESGYDVIVAGIDKFAVFYRRYGVLVVGGTFLTGVSLPAFSTYTITNLFKSNKTRVEACINLLNPSDPSYVDNLDQRSEDFEDCYFRYLKKKLGKSFYNELESNIEVSVKVPGPNEGTYETKTIKKVQTHPKYSKFLEIEKQFRETLAEASKNWRTRESFQNEYINEVDPDLLRKGFPLNDIEE